MSQSVVNGDNTFENCFEQKYRTSKGEKYEERERESERERCVLEDCAYEKDV